MDFEKMTRKTIRKIDLSKIWDNTDESPIWGLMDDPYDLIAEADKDSKDTRFRRIILRLSGMVAAAVAIFFIAQRVIYVSGVFAPDMYLSSSEYSKGYFELPDGSKVWLNQGSSLYIPKGMNGRVRDVRLSGEGYFEVARNEAKPFVVKTQEFDLEVLGTKFTVSAYDGKPSAAYLSEGCVKVSGSDMPEKVLKPDQKIERNASGEWMVSQEKAINHVAWIGDCLFFDDAPIEEIVQCLEHWYNVKISLADNESLRSQNLTMTVRTEPLDEILVALTSLVPMEYHYLDSDHVFLDMD